MKKLVFALLTMSCIQLQAQVSIFSENFDGATVNMTSSSTGTGSWSLSNTLKTSGTSSDTARVQLSDTLFLESATINTTGYTFLSLNFSHICKIDFFDRAKLEYSTNNGASWTAITTSNYTGSGNFVNNSFSSVSYSIWNPGNATAMPQQNWFRNEVFNISAAANQTQVKIRFLLIDADNNGHRNNYGWIIDDVEVFGSPCELIPPTITYTSPIYQGATYGTGPFTINADIVDASGIASATLSYTINGGSSNTLTMNNVSGNSYQATIPAATVNDTICYFISATDNTTCMNTASNPSGGCTSFFINPAAPPNCVGNPVSSFNYSETFATFTPGNGQNTVGTLTNNWQNDNGDTHDWWVYNTATRSANTGPTSDHSPTDANYMYVEASGSFSSKIARLISPCYNLGGLLAPKLSFWYHMYGAAMGELHIDLHDGNNWILDIAPAIIGDQGNQWLFKEINLSAYSGNIIQLRFRANTGTSFTSDIAIDDIEIIEPIPNELSLISIVSPSSASCNGSATEQVTVKVENYGSLSQDTIPLAYRVNGGAIVRDTAFFNLTPNSSFNHTFQPTFNMSTAGTYSIDAWLELQSDGKKSNDSILNVTVTTSSILTNLPDTTTFDNYTLGPVSGNWTNDPANIYDWEVNNGNTPSGQTGPSGDTSSAAGTGNYVYYEATNVPRGETGSFFSNCIDISNTNKPELKFYYHMNGIEMGELHVDLNLNGFLIQDIIPTISGNKGNQWLEQVVDLTPYKGNIRIVFRAVRGTGYRSDIAVDQIRIRDARPVGVDELSTSTENFLLYPNPFKEQLNLQLKETSMVTIYTVTGALVYQRNLTEGLQQLDLQQLADGIYFLKVLTNATEQTLKIIKN